MTNIPYTVVSQVQSTWLSANRTPVTGVIVTVQPGGSSDTIEVNVPQINYTPDGVRALVEAQLQTYAAVSQLGNG